jgi:hypothetical protein
VTIDPTWFTKDNDEFRRTHLPMKVADMYSPPIKEEDFWRESLADFTGHTQGYHISKQTIAPAQYRIPWGVQTFKYGRACGHILPTRVPTFVLHFPRDGLSRLATLQTALPFEYNTVDGTWSRTVDLSKYATSNTVELVGVFKKGETPASDNSDLSSFEGPMSDFINGVPWCIPVASEPRPELMGEWRRRERAHRKSLY